MSKIYSLYNASNSFLKRSFGAWLFLLLAVDYKQQYEGLLLFFVFFLLLQIAAHTESDQTQSNQSNKHNHQAPTRTACPRFYI